MKAKSRMFFSLVVGAGVLSLASLSSLSSFAAAADDLASFVDPFTGTAGRGHTHPAACVPFGMVQAGPDNGPDLNDGLWLYCSGYQFKDKFILGYSLTHLSGTGCTGYNDAEILPFMGDVRAMPMRSAIGKATEKAEPGYYRVTQPEDGVETEVAAAKRSAIYRFTWTKAGTANILVNFRPPAMRRAISDASLSAEGESTLTGSYSSRVWMGAPRMAFAFAFSKPWTSWRELPKEKESDAPRYLVSFDVKAGEQLLLKAGLSTTDEAGARANLVADIPGWDFFTEANAFQYSWHVMQDVPGLVAAHGGREGFVAALDRLFQAPEKKVDATGDITGMIGQYVHGNEPSHHVIYFYPQVGEPAKAAERIREVCETQYHLGPKGLSGNDDCGQMSAWYVFSALGFYPFNPCGGEYVIGAPQVPAATLRFPNGKTFRMVAKNLSKENKYVKSVKFNGKPVADWKLRHADIVAGGTLVFEMGKDR